MAAKTRQIILAVLLLIPWASATSAQQCARGLCPGDIDRNEKVTVDELITSVNAALTGCRPSSSRVCIEGADIVPGTITADHLAPGVLPGSSAARVYASSNQVLSPPARVSLDAKTFDRLGEFSTANSVFTASQAGHYSVSAVTVLEDDVCAQAQVFTIRKNGVVYSQMKYAPPPVGTETPDNNPQINLSDIVELAAGDTLELWLEAADCQQVKLFGGEAARDVTFLAIGRLP